LITEPGTKAVKESAIVVFVSACELQFVNIADARRLRVIPVKTLRVLMNNFLRDLGEQK
jgi:hypothetical protein